MAEGGAGRGEDHLGFWWQLTSRFYFDKDHAKVTSAVLHAQTQVLVVGFQTGVFSLYDLPGGGRADGAALAAADLMGVDPPTEKPGAPPRPTNAGRLQEIHTLSISEARVDACAVSPSGEWLAFGCSQLGQLMVWEWRSESYILKQQGHYFAEVNALAFSPGGSVIATAGGDSKVKLWSPSTGFCFVTFTEHTAPVVDLAFVPHGRALVSASLDGTVRAYDLMRYRNFQTLVSPEPCQFNAVAVEPSGEIVCAARATHCSSTCGTHKRVTWSRRWRARGADLVPRIWRRPGRPSYLARLVGQNGACGTSSPPSPWSTCFAIHPT